MSYYANMVFYFILNEESMKVSFGRVILYIT